MNKIFLAILVAISITSIIAVDDDEADWQAFKIKFGKLFLSKGKETQRRATFKKNKAKLEELQEHYDAGKITYKPALYAFHDLEPEEIMDRMTGLKGPDMNETKSTEEFIETRATLPASYDARTVFQFNPIRNQGQCGSCWTFSSINPIEVGYAKKYNQLLDLSEQQLLNCVYAALGLVGCSGGWMETAWNYLILNGGVSEESVIPYTGVCQACVKKTTRVKISTHSKIGTTEDVIKNAIMTYGSLSVAVDCSGWYNYGSGVYSSTTVKAYNHAVNLIGWGTDATTKTNYWLIRNSWGDWWGEKGHIRVATSVYGSLKTDYIYSVTVA